MRLPRYPMVYPPQLISSYEQTTSIVPVFGCAKIPSAVFSSKYTELSLVMTASVENVGTDNVIPIDTVLAADV